MVIQLALATPCKVRGIELVETRHLEECLKMLRRLSQIEVADRVQFEQRYENVSDISMTLPLFLLTTFCFRHL
jgi:hypothetical protein